MEININEVKILLGAIDDLLEIKSIIRKITPDYKFDDIQKKMFKD